MLKSVSGNLINTFVLWNSTTKTSKLTRSFPDSPLNSLSSLVLLAGVAEVATESLHPLLGVPVPVGPGGGTEALVALQEDLELPAVAEASSPDTKVLHQAQILHLVANYLLVK